MVSLVTDYYKLECLLSLCSTASIFNCKSKMFYKEIKDVSGLYAVAFALATNMGDLLLSVI